MTQGEKHAPVVDARLRLGPGGARRARHQDECNHIRRPHKLLGNNDGVSRLENQVPAELSFVHEIIVVEREVNESTVDVSDYENLTQFCELLEAAGDRERLGDADGSGVGEGSLLGDFAENEELRAVGLLDGDGDSFTSRRAFFCP